MVSRFLILITALVVALPLQAQTATPSSESNLMDELDPHDPNVEQTLEEYDRIYEAETGMPSHLFSLFAKPRETCFRQTCPVWAQVVKSTQVLYLYVNGVVTYTWKVSTGANNSTPDFDTHPNGRIYDKYTSTSFPDGDYKGLGNMPYAVFFYGGYAIHGTTQGNWKRLGTPASHGCVRLHPDNAQIFNRLVRQQGIYNVWITVQQ
jgi:hypothetical protein